MINKIVLECNMKISNIKIHCLFIGKMYQLFVKISYISQTTNKNKLKIFDDFVE